MRISDWSSDVCSSDLIKVALRGQTGDGRVDAAACRNLQTLVAARVGFDGEVQLSELAKQWPHAESDARVFADMGLIDLLQRPGGPALSIMDSRIVTIWQQMRAEGYTEENGFPPTVVDFYAEPADKIAREESQRFVERSEDRRVGKEGVSTVRSGGSPGPIKKKK